MENDGESQAVTEDGRARKKRAARRREEIMDIALVWIPRMIEDDLQKIASENRRQEDL